MRISFRTTATAVVAALALAAAGCGSSSDDKPDTDAAFKTGYTAQSATIKTVGIAIGEAIDGAKDQTDAQLVTTFSALAGKTHDLVDGIGGLTPPDTATADLKTLERALTKAAADLDAIVTAARAGDAASAEKASAALVVDSTPVMESRAALDKLVKGR